ncbi:MAG: hypothetical protein K0U98_14925 [Deltaproteobacteria bacterium]|nr:hypothetical protein [Deltaproteobacteria bacterium]
MTVSAQNRFGKRRSLKRLGSAFLLLLLALALAHVGFRQFRESRQVTLSAQWIWARVAKKDLKKSPPQIIHAARDFDLESSPGKARLLILADEEYRVSLNGRPLGGNRYQPGAGLDVYQVADWLHTGTNRLWVQLSSMRGGGGLLASLQSRNAEGDWVELVATDGSWRILRTTERRQEQGLLPLDPSESPQVWGRPPIGRWGSPQIGDERAVPGPLVGSIPKVLRPTSVATDPKREAVWIFDWGRLVTGYLTLELASGTHPWGEVQFASELPRVWPDAPDGTILTPKDHLHWQDVALRRFRYARVRGIHRIDAAFVLEGEATSAAGKIFVPAAPPSLMGLEPPPLRTPIGDYVNHVSREQEDSTSDPNS